MMKAITRHSYSHTLSRTPWGLIEFVTKDTKEALRAKGGAADYDQGADGLLWRLSGVCPGCLRSSRP